jgi:hypothetical protein
MISTEVLGHSFPADIDYFPDKSSCVSSAYAFTLYKIGAPEELWQPAAIDIILGRKPGEVTYSAGVLNPVLMDQGARLTSIASFENARFVGAIIHHV